MKMYLKIWHLLSILFFMIFIIRFDLILNIYLLIFNWFILLLNDFEIAFAQLNFRLIDIFISALLFILIPIIFLIFRNKLLFIHSKISFSSLVLISLAISFLFAPLITTRNPDFYKNIGMTKLLPPLSSVNILHFKNTNVQYESDFFYLKDKIVAKPFDESIEYVDSIIAGEQLIFFQNENRKEVDEDKVVFKDNKPLLTKKIFLLGTDQFGRDIFTRIIYGARISLLVGIGSVFISLLIGSTLGFLAGYTGGIFDIILSRITDMFLSFPIIFLVVLILALFGNTLFAVIVVLGFSGWMSLFKIVKTEVLSVKQKNYFISAKLLGLNKRQLYIKEVLPVIVVPVVVNLIFQFGAVVIAESALSYLGLGLGENYPSWGSMIQAGQEYLSLAWWMIFFPGITIIFTLLSANRFGELLNKRLNPRLQND